MSFLRWLIGMSREQCCAEMDCGHNVTAYCIRNKGHWGWHVANDGTRFMP